MPSRTLYRLYREVKSRACFYDPRGQVKALYAQAVSLARFQAAERTGFVRLRCELDEDFDPRDFMEDSDIQDSDWEAYGSIGEYRLSLDSEDWVHADSCWGHVGYRDVLDWTENPYILDIMAETLEAFRTARKRSVLASPVPSW
jgi:hypothetical protein